MPAIAAEVVELKPSEWTIDGKAVREDAKRHFRVPFDSDINFGKQAALAPGVPLVGDTHPNDARLRVTRVRPKRVQRRIYEVEVEYSTDYQPPNSDAEDPLDRRGEVSYDTASYEEAIEETVDGPPLPILTKTFEKFSPPLTAKKHRISITVVQNASTSGILRIAPFLESVNKEVFLGLPPLCVCFTKFRPVPQRHATFGLYWQRTYNFEFIPPDNYPDYDVANDNSPWDARPLHKGFYSINPAGTGIVPNLDRSGQNVERLLDDDGFELAVLSGARPVYLHFRRNHRETWSPGLEIDFDRLDY